MKTVSDAGNALRHAVLNQYGFTLTIQYSLPIPSPGFQISHENRGTGKIYSLKLTYGINKHYVRNDAVNFYVIT
jgi:hypothetical protein